MKGVEEKVMDNEKELKRFEGEVGHFWAGEAEVVESYLTRPGFRTPEKDIVVLKMQCVFESGPGIGGFARNIHRIAEMVDFLDETISRQEFKEELQTQLQEVFHYNGFKDLLEELMGHTVSHKALVDEFCQAPWTSWSRAYYAYRAQHTSSVEKAGISFCRGQGCADMTVYCRHGGDPFKDRLAKFAKQVIRDELSHGPSEGKHLLMKVCKTEEDWRVAFQAACEVSRIHLLARNQQYGSPLGEKRIEEICRFENRAITLAEVASIGGYRLEDFGWTEHLHP
jgi:hypothetical protein